MQAQKGGHSQRKDPKEGSTHELSVKQEYSEASEHRDGMNTHSWESHT